MSYIPCIRKKYETKRYRTKASEKEINGYWQGFLDDKGIENLRGFDIAADFVENFFENLEVYQDVFADVIERYKEATGKDAVLKISDDIVASDVVNMPVFNKEEELSDEDLRTVSLPTILARAMYESLMDWLEMHRDEFGVSMIDCMDEDEYEKIKEAVLKGERKNRYTEV